MTGKTTQQLAREAGIEDYNEMLRSVVVTDNGTYINPVTMADLERFRALVLEEAINAALQDDRRLGAAPEIPFDQELVKLRLRIRAAEKKAEEAKAAFLSARNDLHGAWQAAHRRATEIGYCLICEKPRAECEKQKHSGLAYPSAP